MIWIINAVKEYFEYMGINARVAKNQIEIAYTGTRGGYDTIIAYYTNKAANIKLYIDYDISRGMANEILSF